MAYMPYLGQDTLTCIDSLSQLANSGVSFSLFKCVVFDEVHHVMKKHPYRKLARLLELASPKPTILGLTATCTYAVGKVQIASDIEKLCTALDIHLLLTADTEELVRDNYHGATPNMELNTSNSTTMTEQELATCDVFDPQATKVDSNFMPHQGREAFFHSIKTRSADRLLIRIMDVTMAVENMISATVPSFTSPLFAKGKMGKVAEWSSYAQKLRAPQANVLMHLYEALRLLVVTWSVALDLAVEYIRMTIGDAKSLMCLGGLATTVQDIIEDGSKPPYTSRFRRLEETLVKQLAVHNGAGDGASGFRGILFVQQRLTTHILENFIRRSENVRQNFRTACIYATAGEASPTFRVTPSQSKERVAQFSRGDVNLLISTAVAEEGMDVPEANCIIRFDPIQTPVSLIQGRGRARQEKSSFVVMEERKDRPLEKLAQAEVVQMNLLQAQSEGIIDAAQSAEALRKRRAAEKSRESSATIWLHAAVAEGKIPPMNMLKTFCAKSDREVVEVCKKSGNLWHAVIRVLGVGGEEVQGEVKEQSKQKAKEEACRIILAKFVHS
jgi:hypothetical protein